MTDISEKPNTDLNETEQSAPTIPDMNNLEEYPEVEAPLLTEEHKRRFEILLAAENVALLSGFYKDIPTGLICFYDRDNYGRITIHPIGLMLTPEMAAEVKDDLGQPLPVL